MGSGTNVRKIKVDVAATGCRIKELMEIKGISTRELSGIMKVSFQAVYRWQHGESLPSLDNLFILGRILETAVDDMLVVIEE